MTNKGYFMPSLQQAGLARHYKCHQMYDMYWTSLKSHIFVFRGSNKTSKVELSLKLQ